MNDVQEITPGVASTLGEGVEECWMEIDGGRMRYLRAGAGPPLILLHGLMAYSFLWRYVLPALAPYATLYAPDLLGAGFSDRPRGIDHSMRATARRVVQFVKKLGLESFDLLGTSRGGAVAMAAAAECVTAGGSEPQVRRLILVCPVNPYSSHGTWLAPFFGTSVGAALFCVGAERMPFMFPYWHGRLYADRSKIPPGKPGRLQSADGDAGNVRAWIEHCAHMDGRSAGTGSAFAELGGDSYAADVGQQGSGGVCFVPGAVVAALQECPKGRFSWGGASAL